VTELEQASLDAFNTLVSHGGMTLNVGTSVVQGLVEFIEPENSNYSLEDGEGQDSIVRVKRSDWPTGYNRQGSVFTITDTSNFRIKSARMDPLFWIFRCEVY
jgi:hypothetical protein